MQSMLASLVVQLGVRDAAYKSGMSAARAEAKRTGQEFEKSADTIGGAMERAALTANRAMVAMVDSLSSASKKAAGVGVALTAALTVPLGLAGKSAKDTAADFQASMNNVRAAMMTASPEQIDKLRASAMRLGPEVGRSAIEAADGIEMLAKNGLSASTILNGALSSSLRLAAANQAGLSESADLTTDIMAQFNKTASDLPMVVDRVTGALDASKLNFQDYALAIGQAGGVAGGLGYDFEEFNAALAASIPLFTSGSDAGTSFKTFLTSLTPASKEAALMMEQLGLNFFDAEGNAKSLGEVAELLRSKLGNLSDRSLNNALQTMFGRDAMRTAISPMQQGADGLDRMEASIAAIKAQDKLDIVMEGDIKATERLSAAWTKLKIEFGSVLIPIFTAVKNALAAVIDTVAGAPPWFFALVAAMGAVAASLGPLGLAILTLAKVAIPLLLLRLGPVVLAFGALVNPVGVLIRLLGQLAINLGAASALGLLGARAVALAGPIGLVISLLLILVPLLTRTASASDEHKRALEQSNERGEKATDITNKLATATGKLRKETLALARAERLRLQINMLAAQNRMHEDRAKMVSAREEARKSLNQNPARLFFDRAGAGAEVGAAHKRASEAVANFDASVQTLGKEIDSLQRVHNAIRGADIMGDGALTDMDFGASAVSAKPSGGSTRVGRSAQEIARDEARYLDELGRIRVMELDAWAELSGGVQERYRAQMAAIEEDRAAFGRQVALDENLSQAQRDELLARQDRADGIRRTIVQQERQDALAQREVDLMRDRIEAEQAVIRDQIDMADNMKARRDGEFRLLDLQKKLERAQLELVLATEAAESAAWENARLRLEALDGIYAAKRDRAGRDTAGPGEAYLQSLNRSAQSVRESVEEIGVQGFERLNDWMVDAVMNAKDLAAAFSNMAKSIVADLIRIAIQQNIVKPLANSLFNGGGGGIPSAGAVAKQNAGAYAAFAAQLANFGGNRALGGRVQAGSWYNVGERGPERFYADRSGVIAPTSAIGRGAPAVIQIVGDEGAAFVPRVAGISGNVSIQQVSAAQRTAALRNRQRLG